MLEPKLRCQLVTAVAIANYYFSRVLVSAVMENSVLKMLLKLLHLWSMWHLIHPHQGYKMELPFFQITNIFFKFSKLSLETIFSRLISFYYFFFVLNLNARRQFLWFYFIFAPKKKYFLTNKIQRTTSDKLEIYYWTEVWNAWRYVASLELCKIISNITHTSRYYTELHHPHSKLQSHACCFKSRGLHYQHNCVQSRCFVLHNVEHWCNVFRFYTNLHKELFFPRSSWISQIGKRNIRGKKHFSM